MRKFATIAAWCALFSAAALFASPPVAAHAFGARYDLPVPLSLYLVAAGAAVALSFVIAAVFLRARADAPERLRLMLPGLAHLLGGWPLRRLVQLASAALFLLIVIAGLIGDQDPYRNLAPTMVWIIWWVGMAYISALLGNLWALVNPWNSLFAGCERLYGVLRPGRRFGFGFAYPGWLGVWPACVLFLVFAWTELIWPARADPSSLAVLILIYSAITWGGMLLFGRRAWLAGGEVFSTVFGLISRFAPLDAGAGGAWRLRLPAAGLAQGGPASPSLIAFVLLLLSSVTYDGFKETPAWASLTGDASGEILPLTLGLIVFALLFLAVFLITCRLMAFAGGGGQGTAALAARFVTSLVPIAIAYHLAHYLSFLLINGQLLVPLASDPFGFGWDLFGTAGYQADIAIVGAKFAWYAALAAITAGHVIAVSLAHIVALRVYGDGWLAMRSQYPMLVLMVGYTVAGLWILAQPLV